MTIRATLLAATALAVLGGLPALAQAPDFGADTSAWANDGECDDPRFEGPGMARGPLLQVDGMADATDCAQAFAQGTIALVGAAAAGAPPALPGKGGVAPAPAATPAAPPAPATAPAPVAPPPATAAAINFGDDSSEWANDGECDDRRFVGAGMATALSWVNAGRDATDCRGLSDAGSIRPWSWPEALAATQCASVDFGDDAGQFAGDGECDDPRFEGLAMAGGVSEAHILHDAGDCLQLCAFGAIALRDY